MPSHAPDRHVLYSNNHIIKLNWRFLFLSSFFLISWFLRYEIKLVIILVVQKVFKYRIGWEICPNYQILQAACITKEPTRPRQSLQCGALKFASRRTTTQKSTPTNSFNYKDQVSSLTGKLVPNNTQLVPKGFPRSISDIHQHCI